MSTNKAIKQIRELFGGMKNEERMRGKENRRKGGGEEEEEKKRKSK